MTAARLFRIGQPVRWLEVDAAGRPCRESSVFIRSFEDVVRSDGSLNGCAILSNNRLAPLDRLVALDAPRLEIEKPAAAPRSRSTKKTADKPAADKTVDRDSPRLADAKPLAKPAAAACGVLAFDFMNLLVRAFHAGKPTETHAVRSMFQTVASAVRTLRPERIVFAFDGGHVHRSQLLPGYKAHRPPHPPELMAQIDLAKRAIQLAGIPAFRVDGFEADDVLASLVDRCHALVICSSDKDLLALHGRCRIFHPWGTGAFVDPETKLGIDAGQVTDFLALCGDTVDGVPGVKGIGEKTASSLLKTHDNLEAILVAAALNQIPGATGQRLREQRETALLCQEVIRLRSSLPLPAVERWTPPDGYQQELQSIGLGSVAGVLDGLLPLLSNETTTTQERKSPCLSAPPGQGEQCGRDEFLQDPQELARAQPSRENRTESRTPSESVVPVESGSRSADTLAASSSATSASVVVRCSIDQPIRKNISMAQRWDSWDHGQISCWESGRSARGRENAENPWKSGTSHHAAWLQGFNGQNLDVVWHPPETEKPAAVRPPRQVKKSRQPGALFS